MLLGMSKNPSQVKGEWLPFTLRRKTNTQGPGSVCHVGHARILQTQQQGLAAPHHVRCQMSTACNGDQR